MRHGLDRADKAKPDLAKCADEPLFAAVVADRGARGTDPAQHCRVRYQPAVPDYLDQLVDADGAVAVGDQMHQKMKNLRLQTFRLALAQKFSATQVDLETVGPIDSVAHDRRLG
jgi:hypothetical protein